MTALFLSLLVSLHAHAGDKINNGGGIWICESNDMQISAAVLVDLYEAENEFKWTLMQTRESDPWKIVESIGSSLADRFPNQATTWLDTLAEVRGRLDFIRGELTIAGDSKYRAKPLPSLCRTGGGWQYRQFANWDDRSNHGIIREDYWQSADISALDKAALVWHEVVYRWLRTKYNDDDSTRAREIVGVLFAEATPEFSREKARERLAEILRRKPAVDPTDPAGTWFCAIQHKQSNLWFTGYGSEKDVAMQKAIGACRDTGDFLGMMCGGPGASVECGQLAAEEKFACSLSYRRGGDEQQFSAKGRSLLEARIKTLKVCGEAVGQEGAWLCQSRETVCK